MKLINFISPGKLKLFLTECKKIFAPISHIHKTSDIENLDENLNNKYDKTAVQTQGTVLAAPSDKDGVASFRKLTKKDIDLGDIAQITVAKNITIPVAEWVATERTDGFKYKWTYMNDKVLGTDEIKVWFNNASLIPASKASVAIDDNSSDGTISFISVKIPEKELAINLIKVCSDTSI